MRKTPIMLVSTAAGLAGVIAFHPSGAGSLKPAAAPTSASQPTPSTTISSSGTQSSSTQSSRTQAASAAQASALGTDEQYGYGALAVRVTVSGARIVDLAVGSLQTAEPYSQSIAQQVIPLLRSEVLAAQGIKIDAISGATYTSEAYAYSVQSALDALHFK